MHILIDFDDTLSEQIPFNLQYVRAIGEMLAPTYGGDVEAWAKSGIDMMERLEADYITRFRSNPLNGYCDWLRGMHAQAAQLLFAGMGLPTPLDPAGLSIRTRVEALKRCDACFPDALDVLRTLHSNGFTIHMASGNDSEHLRAALHSPGLNRYIDRYFGPDLIDCAKEGTEFYARIFHTLNLPAQSALVVDNDPVAIGWAIAAGAQAIQVKLLPYHHVETAPGVLAVVTDLRQLPKAIIESS